MAIKAGLTLLEIIEQYVRRMMMGKGSGILKIPPKKEVNKFAKELLKKFKENGIPDNAINNPKDVRAVWEQITNREAQIMQNNMMDIVREGTEKFKTKKSADVHPFQGFTPTIVKGGKPKEGIGTLFKDSPERIAQLKAENKAAIKRLKDKKKTVEEFRDDGDWDPSGLASGGLARVGMFGGGPIVIVKGGNWFLKALRDTRKLMTQNKQHSPEQLKYYLNQIDDQIKNIEAGGKIPDEVIQMIRKDPKFKSLTQNPANDPDLREIEEVLIEYGEKHASGGRAGSGLNYLLGEDDQNVRMSYGGRVPLAGGGGFWKLVQKAFAKLKKNKKPENYIMDQGYKLGKYYKKHPEKGADAAAATGAGILIARHLDRQKETSGGRIGYAQGIGPVGPKTKRYYKKMPEIDPYKKFFRRRNKLMKFKNSKGLAEILGV